MSNWVISVNIKQLVLKKKREKKKRTIEEILPSSIKRQFRKPWTKKWNILLVPESTHLAVLTMITK